MSDKTPRPRVRFAPSPTGYLHVGGARTALFNWLFARRSHGTFILRIEDTDAARNTAEATAAIFDGLCWLGLDWDEGPNRGGDYGPYFQSQRKTIYDRYLADLTERGLTYTEENGAVRFRSPKEILLLPDQICGDVKIDRTNEPDMTIRRPDGSYIFHFVNVVDDIEMKITHVLRGEDHIYNTGKHIELFHAFGMEPPIYAHIPLIMNADGSKMSKRDQGAAVGYYMENGFIPQAVCNYLCLLGWSSKDDREIHSLNDVVTLFDWDHLNHHNAKFDLEKCRWMNGEYIKAQTNHDFIRNCLKWLPGQGLPAAPSESLLRAVLALIKPKVRVASEIAEHLHMVFNGAARLADDARAKLAAQGDTGAKLSCLTSHLEALVNWEHSHIQEGISMAARDLSVKPGTLMFPLRVAVTGQAHGIDLLPLLELLGKQEITARLRARIGLLSA